jgi:hypothetical protein
MSGGVISFWVDASKSPQVVDAANPLPVTAAIPGTLNDNIVQVGGVGVPSGGGAYAANAPLLPVGGSDGVTARVLHTDASGNLFVTASAGTPVNAIVTGNVASAAVDSGNPVKVGGKVDTSFPTISTGQRTDWIFGTRGSGFVSIMDAASAVGASVQGPADGQSNNIGGLWVNGRGLIFNGGSWDRQVSINSLGFAPLTGFGIAATQNVPTASQGASIPPSNNTAVASNLVVKASAGNLYHVACVAGASAGFLMVFDATSAPADGAVTPKIVRPIAANGSVDIPFDTPYRFNTGITLVFSTTGPFTKTASATAYFEAIAA